MRFKKGIKCDNRSAPWPHHARSRKCPTRLRAMLEEIISTAAEEICGKCRRNIDHCPMYTEHPMYIPPEVGRFEKSN